MQSWTVYVHSCHLSKSDRFREHSSQNFCVLLQPFFLILKAIETLKQQITDGSLDDVYLSGAPVGQNLNIKEEIPDDYEPAHYGAFFISFCSVSKITIILLPWNFDKIKVLPSFLKTTKLASKTINKIPISRRIWNDSGFLGWPRMHVFHSKLTQSNFYQ